MLLLRLLLVLLVLSLPVLRLDIVHGLQEVTAFDHGVTIRVSVLLAILSLHEDATGLAGDERVVTGLDRVNVELLSGRLQWQVFALAELVGEFILVVRRRLVEVMMVLECELLHSG